MFYLNTYVYLHANAYTLKLKTPTNTHTHRPILLLHIIIMLLVFDIYINSENCESEPYINDVILRIPLYCKSFDDRCTWLKIVGPTA